MKSTAVGPNTTLAERKRKAGQRLVIGFAGPAVDDTLREIVRDIRPAGMILFGRNVVSPTQVTDLNRALRDLFGKDDPPILSVDQEGGRVQRIRAPSTVWPPMRQLAQREDLISAVSKAMAIELREMGFNLNFAPVADVDSNPDNPVIGDRSFGRTAEETARRIVPFIHAHQAEGIAACAKHFPGHGDTNKDSHFELPTVDCGLNTLQQRELVPFQAAVQAGVRSIMSAHVLFPALDPHLPATLSPRVIPELLRKQLGYEGLVFSDDMEMKAIHGSWSVEAQAQQTTLATVDILLACKSADLQMELFEQLVRIQEADERLEYLTAMSARRIQSFKDTLPRAQASPMAESGFDRDEHHRLAERVG